MFLSLKEKYSVFKFLIVLNDFELNISKEHHFETASYKIKILEDCKLCYQCMCKKCPRAIYIRSET